MESLKATAGTAGLPSLDGALSPPLTPAFPGPRHGILTNGDSPPGSNGTHVEPAEHSPSIINGFQPDGTDFDPTTQRHDSHPIPAYQVHTDDPAGPRSRAHAFIRSYADDDHRAAFPRISKPVELMRSAYDVVVIGSGYGGGIAASRMARTGQSVCVLERGCEKWPGEYPAGTADVLKELHVSGNFSPGVWSGVPVETGNLTGMYHFVFGKGQNAVVGNGLGGTSLINANVFMEADKDTLAMKAWPPQIRENVDEMERYYKKVEDVLQPEEYPDDWPKLHKVEVFKKQTNSLGEGKFKKVRQTTRFKNGPNSCGVEMSASSLTGQDATGINDGSKTTTLVTYLADAWNWGAEMFCESEVRYIEKCKAPREGYLIYFAWHGRNRGHFKANLHGDLMWVHAKKAVFLGAGTLGTTEILLRSKAMGLPMSDFVGQNMSGNGDILAFGYNTDEKVNGIGRPFPSPYNPIGPCINSVLDCRGGHENPLDGFIIEEGSVPHALSHFLQTMIDIIPGKVEPNENVVERAQATLARYGSRLFGPYFPNGSIERTQTYLIMSHDSNQAILTLKDDKPVLQFLGVGRSDHVKELNKKLERVTKAVGGTFVQSPWYGLLGQQEVTVHPIGGACMARDNTGQTGVTNHAGELLTGRTAEVHDGLIVADGSIVPTALAANPFATIAALAERAVEHYAHKKGLVISDEENEILDLFGEPAHLPRMLTIEEVGTREETTSINGTTDIIQKAEDIKAMGFGFSEVMSGFIHHDEGMKDDSRETYELAYRTAKSLCESARFFLSVQSFDIKTIINGSQHRGMLTGTFVCPTLSGSPFMVQRGEFNLFIKDHKAPGTRNLTYDFDMKGVNGEKLHFHGYKVVDSSVALAPIQFWKSTSTLYVTVSEHVPGMTNDLDDEEAWRKGKVLAKGMMHIEPADFLSEILTLSPTGSSLLKKAVSTASFLTFFTRKSMSLLLAPFTRIQYPSQSYHGYINNCPPQHSIAIHADDGVYTRMHIWEPTHYPGNDKSNIKNLFMVPGAAVDHQIYALPTIPYNAVNYFTRAGYRVFISVHRIGQLMVAENDWTTYDARLDLRACLQYIRENYGPNKVYTIAHCMGSVAFSAGMLDGTIPADWILGVSCSQVFMNPIWFVENKLKIRGTPIPLDWLYRKLAGNWYSCTSGPDNSYVQLAIDQALRFYPDLRREICNNAACHRTSFVFGRCWNHANLNEATHRQMDRFMGGINMTCLHLLMKQGNEGHVMKNKEQGFERLTTPENIQRLKGIPFFLWVGRDNAVLSPESTLSTYETLTDAFGSNWGSGNEYRRVVVSGYGHLDGWMGRNAWKDVYPMIREEVDRVCRGETYRFVEPDDKFKRMVDEGGLLH